MTPDDGSLTLGERLSRFEVLLEGIDKKLDTKVDYRELERIVKRIEGHDEALLDIRLHGSAQAQDAVKEAGKLEEKLDNLNLTVNTQLAVQQDRANQRFMWMRVWGVAVSVVAVGGSIAGLVMH